MAWFERRVVSGTHSARCTVEEQRGIWQEVIAPTTTPPINTARTAAAATKGLLLLSAAWQHTVLLVWCFLEHYNQEDGA